MSVSVTAKTNVKLWLPCDSKLAMALCAVAPACVTVVVRLSKALKEAHLKGQTIRTYVRPASKTSVTQKNLSS